MAHQHRPRVSVWWAGCRRGFQIVSCEHCVLPLSLPHHRDRCGPPQKRDRTVTKLEALRRDQTTSTTHIQHIGSAKATLRAEDRAPPHGTGSPSRSPQRPGLAGPEAEERVALVGTRDPFQLRGEDAAFLPAQQRAHSRAPPASRGGAEEEQRRHLYGQPLAVLQSADLFAPEQLPAARPATLPRKGPLLYAPLLASGPGEPLAQTLPPTPGLAHAPPAHEEGAPAPAPGPGWARYPSSLLESVSVPGALHEAVAAVAGAPFPTELQGLSERTLRALSQAPPGPHPRAWFVSLDGQPVAPVRHSFIDLQRGRRGRSNDASLDSGVDMHEPHAGLGRRPERDATFSRGMARALDLEDLDLSGSESGTAVCSPEDPAPVGGGSLPEHPGEEAPARRGAGEEAPARRGVREEAPARRGPRDDAGAATSPTRKRGRLPLAKRDSKANIWKKREERPLLPIN